LTFDPKGLVICRLQIKSISHLGGWAAFPNTKNRSPRRSTPRHPISMASTTKPPNPMPCALAAILLPESLAQDCHMQKTLFPGPALRAREGVRARAVPACGVRSCGVGGRQESGQRHGCPGAVHDTTGGLRPLVWSCSQRVATARAVCEWTRGGLGVAVSSRCTGSDMRGRLDWCGVRWLFQGCCSGDRLRHWTAAAWRAGGLRKLCFCKNNKRMIINVPDNAFSQGVQELNASTGAC
jgi:hypothetical protein